MPGSRTYGGLTEEELAELDDELTSRAGGVPRLPASVVASVDTTPLSRMEIGDLEMLGPGSNDAWLDELIDRPEPAPAPPRAQISASGAGGTFAGEDTPEARELIKQRGMQVTEQAPPSDEDLLDARVSSRPSMMPDFGDEDMDALIQREGELMDREAVGPRYGAGPAQQYMPQYSREQAVLDSMQPPTRMQGIAAAIGDAFFGGDRTAGLNARAHAYQQALAQARMQDVAAGERSDERGAQRALSDARLGVTMRGQDLADARAEEARKQQRELADRSDQRIREEGALGRDAAMARARVAAEGRARNEAPELSPEQERAGLAGYLSEQANTSEAEAQAYLAGKTEGIAPGKLERLRATDNQLKLLPPAQRGTVIAQGLGRAGADRDRKEPEKLAARNALIEQHAAIKEASEAWAQMSPRAKQIVAKVGGGDSALGSLARSALLSPEDQARAAKIQALANTLIKAQSGASVTAGEWTRVATELGLPKDGFSAFNDPASIDAWLKKSRDGFRRVRDSTLQTYQDLFDGMEQP